MSRITSIRQLHSMHPEPPPKIVSIADEIKANISGLRSARELMADAVAHGDHSEARRHDDRRWAYAETIRNIVRERGPLARPAFLIAQRECRL